MSELQVRLNRLEAEIARDKQSIVLAQARISANEEEMVSLRQQILVSRRRADGSLPAVSFNRLEMDVARRGIEAMKCQVCHDQPDDSRLNRCGHLYWAECCERISGGRCRHRSCRKRLRDVIEIDNMLYEALCTHFGVSFALQSDSEEGTGADSSDNSSAMQTPRASRFGVSIHDEITSPQLGQFQHLHPVTAPYDENSSEDDGFDDRSQRSTGYGDDGDSFVSEDESVDMEANFEPDESVKKRNICRLTRLKTNWSSSRDIQYNGR